MAGKTILELQEITKVYGNGIVANKGISFDLVEGEIHAIVGENGAGKSTLMKILFGMEQPTKGKILFRGEETAIHSPEDAIEMGIGMVHQHFMLVPSFTVVQNLLLGTEPHKGVFIDREKARDITKMLADKYSMQVNLDEKVEDISVGMKQKVEILKALYRGARILILDEPTAVLTPQETEELFVQLKQLKEDGHTIIFISHKLKEVKEISDRVSVIRKGVFQGVYRTADVTESQISNLMVGRDVVLQYGDRQGKAGNAVFSVRNLSHKIEKKEILKDISFSLREGQILGIAGVEGNGQSELIELLTRNRNLQEGDVALEGQSIRELDIVDLRVKGLSYIPEDRMSVGVAAEASILDNILGNRLMLDEFTEKALLKGREMVKTSQNLIEKFLVKCSGGAQKVNMLSGGNIQKVVVARECSVNPKVLIAAQPTRGVDVGAIEFIHHQLLDMRDDGAAILLISADLNEILELSDAIMVMYEGEIVAYFEDSKKVTEEELGLCMLGLKKHEKDQIGRACHES